MTGLLRKPLSPFVAAVGTPSFHTTSSNYYSTKITSIRLDSVIFQEDDSSGLASTELESMHLVLNFYRAPVHSVVGERAFLRYVIFAGKYDLKS